MSLLGRYRSAWTGLSRELWLLAGVGLVHRSGTMVLPFLALWLTRERGFGLVEAGAVVGLYGLGSLAGVSIGGRLADRFGPLAVLAGSLTLGGLGLFVLGTLEDPMAIRAMVFLQATAMEIGRPAGAAAVAALAGPEQRARAFALWRTAVNLGTTIGPAVGGLLAVLDYRLLFAVDGATSLAAAAVLVRTLGLRLAPAVSAEAPATARSPWRDGLFLVVLVLLVLHASVFFQCLGTLPLYLVEARGFDERAVGLTFAANTLTIGLFEMPLVHRLERRAPLGLMAVGALLVGLGYGLVPWGAGLLWILFTVFVWTFGEMLLEPFAASFVTSRAGEKSRGRFLGLHSTAYAVAFVLAPIVGTSVWERFGPDAVWHVGLVVSALAAAGLALAARRA